MTFGRCLRRSLLMVVVPALGLVTTWGFQGSPHKPVAAVRASAPPSNRADASDTAHRKGRIEAIGFRMGLEELGRGLRERGAFVELGGAIWDAAEVQMNPASAAIFARHKLLERGSLTKIILDELESFQKSLRLGGSERSDLSIITVHVKGTLTQGGGNHSKVVASQNVSICARGKELSI